MKIEDLVQDANLASVQHIEYRGFLKTDASPTEVVEHNTDHEVTDDEIDISIDINPKSWGQVIETWFRVTFETQECRIVDTVKVEYSRSSTEEISEDVQKEFIEKVSIMAAFPYLREGVHSMGARLELGSIPLLPILRLGNFEVNGPTETGSGTGE